MLLQALCFISEPSVYLNWSYSPETPNLAENRRYFEPCDLEIWRMTLKNTRAHPRCCFKLFASFRSHQWIWTGVTVRKRPIWVKIDDFVSRVTLQFDGWPFLSNIKLCASFHHHMWIQTGDTVWKRLSWLLTSVTLTFDLWPWPIAWTSPLSLVITPENFIMIRWWEHSQKGVTDRQTDRQTDWTIHRAAWSQLKNTCDENVTLIMSIRVS